MVIDFHAIVSIRFVAYLVMQKSVYRKQRSVFGRARDVRAVALCFHDNAVLAEFFIVDFDICFGCEELGRAHGNVVCVIVVRHFLVVGYREFYRG